MTYPDLLLNDANAMNATCDDIQILPLDAVISNGLSGIFRSHYRAYRDVVIHTYDLSLMRKPFNKAVLLRILARRRCWFKDDQGRMKSLSIFSFPGLAWTLATANLLGAYGKRRFLRRLHDLEMNLSKKPLKIQGEGIPIYFRTDLVFGLRSGGSVTHIAGVINSLFALKGGVRMITTDKIPTVSDDVDLHVVLPETRYSDVPEIRQLLFNEHLESIAKDELVGERPAFIYQRYSVNNIAGVLLSDHLGVPFVLEYNGSEVWINRNWGQALKDEDTALRIEALNLKSADLIVVVSQVLAEELLDRGVESKQILVNPNGVDTDRYYPGIDDDSVRSRHGLQNKFVVGFIGTFGPWHGAEIQAEAAGLFFRDHPTQRGLVKFLFIGDGQGLPEVRSIVKQNGAEPDCVFTGLVPQEEGSSHMAACDILVSPHIDNKDGSRFFGSPTKLFEYMAMGRPIIASDLEQIGEVLTHDKTAWMVPPGNPVALAEGIARLQENEDLRKRLSMEARKVAFEKHTWLQHTRHILDALNKICPESTTNVKT